MKKQNNNGFYGDGKYECSFEHSYFTKRRQKCHICGEKIDLCVDKFMTIANVVFYSGKKPWFSFDEKKKGVNSDQQKIIGKFGCHDCHIAISELMIDINKKSKLKQAG